jgi:hypothetical protein
MAALCLALQCLSSLGRLQLGCSIKTIEAFF